MKRWMWMLVGVLVTAGLAWPKLEPLWSSAESASTAETQRKPGKSSAGLSTDDRSGATKSGKGKSGDSPLKVRTYLVTPTSFAEEVMATGSLRADEGVDLQAEASGKVVSINFEEGQPVKKGALLVKLNDAELQANLTRYTHARELAQLRESRYRKLLDQKVITQNEYDEVKNDVLIQQAYMDLYKAQILKTEIRAPFDGVVGLRYVSLGAYINATSTNPTRIATLQRLDKLKIDFSIPEKYTGRLKVGSSIRFTVAGGAKTFTGRIYAIDPRIDTGTRTLLLRAVCPNDEGHLLPGAFANVSVVMEELPDAVLVPSEAVIAGLDEKNVYVIKDGKAERRTVLTGSRTATQVHVLGGLSIGDVVITSGLQQLRAGQLVSSLDGDESGGKQQPGSESTQPAGRTGA